MADTVIMPKLGFDMAEGTLVRWRKGEGESILKGEVLAEIETDKATVEVESAFSGVVYRHLVTKDSVVPVGTPIAIIAAPGERVVEDGIQAKQAGSAVQKGIAPTQAAAVSTGLPAAPKEETLMQLPATPSVVKASPLAKHMALENGLDLRLLKGSGPGGRVVRKDIEAVLSTALAAPAPTADVSTQTPGVITATPAPKQTSLPATQINVEMADEHIPLERLRAIIGRRMVEAKQQIPHFYVTHTYDMEALVILRKEINGYLPEDQKISVHDFIIKAVALSLRQFSNLNATLTANEIIRHGHIHIGSAVSIKDGLMTVVCRDADAKPLRQIASEMRGMVQRVRNGKVRPEDIEGSSFTISNLGMYDVEDFIAIINPPEVAILAVGTAQQVPVVKNGQLQAGWRMKATLSADHRVTDGVEAAQFLQALEGYLETPTKMLI